MSSGIKKSLIALSISGALFAPSAFATNGYFAHGYSTAEKGLAGAGVAFSQDAMSIATNPAGIAGMRGRMDVGAALFNPNRSYTVTGGPSEACGPTGCTFSIGPGAVDSNMDLFLIPHFAYNWQLDSDSSTAIAMYGNGGMNTNYNGGSATFFNPQAGAFVNPPGTFGNGSTGVDLKQLFVNFSYATKLNDSNSVGASIIYAYQMFAAKGLGSFAPFSSDPSSISGNGDDSSMGFGAKLGWQGKVSDDISLGLSYQSKIAMSEFEKYSGLFAEGGDFDIPATATLGLAWKTSKQSTLVLDIQSIYYSDVASLNNSISQLSPTAAQCNPIGGPGNETGTAGQGPGCLGGSAGAGFGWQDMTVIKLGYQWLAGDMTYRVGLSNGGQPIPDSETMFNILAPAVMETHVTFGFTLPLSSSSEFAFAAMYAPNSSVSGASPFDPAQTINIEMTQIEMQATYSMLF